MVALWAAVQRLPTRVAELEAKLQEPVQDARNARIPPSHTRQAPPHPLTARGCVARPVSVVRVVDAPLPPDPGQVIIAQAKVGPPCGPEVPEAGQSRQAVYDKLEWPPVKPIVTRVEPSGGCGADCGQRYGAPVPAGMEPGTPVGASVQRLATYLRDTHAIRDERRSALLAQGCGRDRRAGGLAHVFRSVKGRMDQRVADIRTRLRRSRLMCRDETRARGHGRQQWAWGFQHPEVCIPGLRPRRGQGVRPEILGAHRPPLGGSDLSRAQKKHPAAPWQVCRAQHVRDGPCAHEAGESVFTPRMPLVWLRALAIHKCRDRLAASTLYQDRCDLRRRVDRCFASQSTNPYGLRLQKRDAKRQENLCLLLEEAPIPPTHHASEQAIRRRTVLRNVTNGFRSDGGRDRLAAVRSVVNTGKRQGLSAVQAIPPALSPVRSLFDPG